MILKDRTYLCFVFLILFSLLLISAGQNFYGNSPRIHNGTYFDNRKKIVWCTISRGEQQKCLNFAMANERDRIKVGYDEFKIECWFAFNKDECMVLLDQEKATMTTLDAGAVFNGGRFHSLVPIAQEVLDGDLKYYYAVAVVKKATLTDVSSLYHLRGKKACFAGVETLAGWVLPINTLMKEGGMEIIDCNNHVKTASNYFGPSCAVNCLNDKYNPIGDNSDKLCQLCIGKIPGGRCTDSDPYAGYEGAFRCLLESGDIAFLKHNTVEDVIGNMDYAGLSTESFELLCKDGLRKSIKEYRDCNWGKVPSDAVVTSSAVSFADRELFQKFLQKAANIYAKRDITYDPNKAGHDQNLNGIEPEFDQYGNRIPPQFDQFGNRIREEFDQYGNKINNNNNNEYSQNNNNNNQFGRKKRQNFGDFGTNPNRNDNPYSRDQENNPYSQNRNNQDNPYSQDNNQNRNENNPYGQNPYNQNQDNPYNRDNNRNPYDQDDRNNPFRNRDNTYIDPYVTDEKKPENPFARDPYSVNRDKYGENVDPYDSDPKYKTDTGPLPFDVYNHFNQSNNTFYEVFSLFESTPRYGLQGNLLFQDSARKLAPVPESMQTYSAFLEGDAYKTIMGVRDCPVNRMTLCVTSDAEQHKCVKMRTAIKAQLLKPEMDCYKGHSQIHCMQAIQSGTADIAVLDASDVYTAGLDFHLVPFISEVYNLEDPEYYVVAVGKESDPSTELTYLRGKNTCHGGINTAAGWVYPLAFLISNGWIRPYGCNSIRAAAEYFTKSCIPGALSTEYNTGVPYDNMCDLCHGPTFRYCRRDHSEDYYGHTGAFRCLVEGGGHVAFVKHTTVTENTGGKKREWWARDNLNDDFELLCPDGTRAEINEYQRCNLGKVKANAIVTRPNTDNNQEINAYINLFMYAQTIYSRKFGDEFSFSMFTSEPPYADLIFSDATTQLKVIEPNQRYYSSYLGPDFMRARRIVDCHAGSSTIGISLITLTLSSLFAIVVLRD